MEDITRKQEMREFVIHEKYILSNFDENSVKQFNASQEELDLVKINLATFGSVQNIV